MTTLTPLGRFLRKLRIDRGELLRDMAEKLGVTMSFLSAIENGKKSMPSEWVALLPSLYQFSDIQNKEFDTALIESEKGIGIKFEGLSEDNKKISAAFARKIRDLSPREQEILQQVLF